MSSASSLPMRLFHGGLLPHTMAPSIFICGEPDVTSWAEREATASSSCFVLATTYTVAEPGRMAGLGTVVEPGTGPGGTRCPAAWLPADAAAAPASGPIPAPPPPGLTTGDAAGP